MLGLMRRTECVVSSHGDRFSLSREEQMYEDRRDFVREFFRLKRLAQDLESEGHQAEAAQVRATIQKNFQREENAR